MSSNMLLRNDIEDKKYTIISIDLKANLLNVVRRISEAVNIPDGFVPATETLARAVEKTVSDDYIAEVAEFVDITKWPEQLKTRTSASVVYTDKEKKLHRAWIIPSHIDDDGEVDSVIMCVRDISDEQEKEDKREAEIRAARTDQLTGLGNRTVFHEVIQEIQYGAGNLPGGFGLLFVDINGLKERNDERGHISGDQLILDTAAAITSIFDRKYVFRHGGDEFIIISFDESEQKFNDKVERLSGCWNDNVSAAVGGVWVTDVTRIDEFMTRADRRMYMDKNLFYRNKKNDRRAENIPEKFDVGLNYVPFEGITFGDEKRFFYVTDLKTNTTRWSANTLEYFDIESEITYDSGKSWLALVHPNDREGVSEDIQQILSGEKQFHCMDYRIRNKEGYYISCTCRGKVISNPSGDGYMFVGAVRNHNISELYDSVTGLNNVFAFIQDTVQHLKYPGDDLLITVGINDFSIINQKQGYEFGNQVLRQFADKLRMIRIDRTHAYRLDGTKFCLAIKRGTIQDAQIIYEEIKRIARQGFVINSIPVSLSVCGGAVLVEKGKDFDEQSIQASLAYVIEQSKHHKHSELVIFNNNTLGKNSDSLALLDALRRAVYNDMAGFYMCYQPVINAQTGKISGAEALVRWNMEPFGEVPPGVFVPLLESDPCFFELGEWIMKQALMDASHLLDKNPDFVININVSAEQIERSGFRDSVVNILTETGFPAQNLCMELTERVISLDLGYLHDELEYFKSLGIQIALDDFGTGVSSMNLLLEIPVDQIKIDRKFVKDIVTNPVEQAIVESIAHCAHRLKLDVCVEGIEDEQMCNFLKQYHVTKHQGYYYSRPLVYNKIIEFLDK